MRLGAWWADGRNSSLLRMTWLCSSDLGALGRGQVPPPSMQASGLLEALHWLKSWNCTNHSTHKHLGTALRIGIQAYTTEKASTKSRTARAQHCCAYDAGRSPLETLHSTPAASLSVAQPAGHDTDEGKRLPWSYLSRVQAACIERKPAR